MRFPNICACEYQGNIEIHNRIKLGVMMSLIHNERTKLLANAFDRASTACIAVGALGQALSLPPAGTMWIGLVSAAGWFLTAVALHLVARHALGRLKP